VKVENLVNNKHNTARIILVHQCAFSKKGKWW